MNLEEAREHLSLTARQYAHGALNLEALERAAAGYANALLRYVGEYIDDGSEQSMFKHADPFPQEKP